MPDSEEPGKRISDQQIQTVCLMVLAGVAGIYMMYWLRPVLVPFVVACFIVSGVGPILTYLENRFNVSRVVAAGMAFLLGVGLMGMFGLTLSFSIIDLAKNKEEYRTRVRQLVDKVDDKLSFEPLSLKKFVGDKFSNEDGESIRSDGGGLAQAPPDATANGNAAIESTPPAEPVEPAASPESPADAESAGAPESAGDAESPADLVPGATLDSGAATVDSPADPAPPSTATSDSDVASASAADADADAEEVDAEESEPLPLLETPTVQIRARSVPVESGRMKEATELVDAFVRDGISVVLQAFLSLVSTSIVVLIYVFFLLLGKSSYAQTATLREIDTQIRGYLSLKTVISIGTGAVFGLTLRMFGVPMALSFGVLAFLLNFIPNIGPIVASLLPIPLILLDPSGNLVWMVSVIVATSAIQILSGNVVEPKLMGNSSDLHPVTILLGLMFWGMMWGIIGMFLATPITAAIKIVLERFEPTRQIANIMAGRLESPAAAP
ncbi:AI-2 transport protein TqsA [Stieleria neptunia]|uniref:AI-2 transport protein TqsA n=1 Tax=Stieleria neptunia TaxID=2527979 RepID=A0A518I3K3_9BACT|nr:AI-2E family transporter [Stieleria neptunia]QDV47654.1 AI-2 transport protein TqsA [Stieleria neptunia]